MVVGNIVVRPVACDWIRAWRHRAILPVFSMKKTTEPTQLSNVKEIGQLMRGKKKWCISIYFFLFTYSGIWCDARASALLYAWDSCESKTLTWPNSEKKKHFHDRSIHRGPKNPTCTVVTQKHRCFFRLGYIRLFYTCEISYDRRCLRRREIKTDNPSQESDYFFPIANHLDGSPIVPHFLCRIPNTIIL